MRLVVAIIRKIGLALLTIWMVSAAIFLATEIIPQNPALAALGIASTPEERAAFRQRAHLDAPLWQRYSHWAEGVLHGNFGASVITGRNVSGELGLATEHTAWLAFSALIVGVGGALALASVTTRGRSRWSERLTSLLALIVISSPDFVVATGVVLIFAVYLGWLPVVSTGPLGGISVRGLVLPSGALALGVAAYIYRIARASIEDCMNASYVIAARLAGYSERRIFWRHIMPNAGIVVGNAIAINAVNLIGGVIVFETVFSYPGLGMLLVSGISEGDITLTAGIGVIMASMFVTINLIAEGVGLALNPRMRTRQV